MPGLQPKTRYGAAARPPRRDARPRPRRASARTCAATKFWSAGSSSSATSPHRLVEQGTRLREGVAEEAGDPHRHVDRAAGPARPAGSTSSPRTRRLSALPDRPHAEQVEDLGDVVAVGAHRRRAPDDDARPLRVARPPRPGTSSSSASASACADLPGGRRRDRVRVDGVEVAAGGQDVRHAARRRAARPGRHVLAVEAAQQVARSRRVVRRRSGTSVVGDVAQHLATTAAVARERLRPPAADGSAASPLGLQLGEQAAAERSSASSSVAVAAESACPRRRPAAADGPAEQRAAIGEQRRVVEIRARGQRAARRLGSVVVVQAGQGQQQLSTCSPSAAGRGCAVRRGSGRPSARRGSRRCAGGSRRSRRRRARRPGQVLVRAGVLDHGLPDLLPDDRQLLRVERLHLVVLVHSCSSSAISS